MLASHRVGASMAIPAELGAAPAGLNPPEKDDASTVASGRGVRDQDTDNNRDSEAATPGVQQAADMKNLTALRAGPALALVEMHDHKPTVTTPRIAELFCRRHFDVMKSIGKLVSAGQINERQLTCIEWVDSKGRKQAGYRLSERDALVLMPFLGGDRAMEGQARLVDAFEHARSQLVRLTNSGPSWRLQRRDAAADASSMCETLELVRLKAGKQTLPHHFINEHRLVAHALTGAVTPLLDRSRLDADTLSLVAEVERLNRKLMRNGIPYADRKVQCRSFVLAESSSEIVLLGAEVTP